MASERAEKVKNWAARKWLAFAAFSVILTVNAVLKGPLDEVTLEYLFKAYCVIVGVEGAKDIVAMARKKLG